MIIKRLTLHNFGVYASDNEFDFKSDKPVVLIGGLNGRGKTTFLEAILIALYGSNSFAYKEGKYNSYGKYLASYVNQSDGSLKTFVELEFLMNEDLYKIRRSWNLLSQKRTQEKIEVYKNSDFSDFLTKNWSMFIENVLPNGLSKFFFFDGEKIAEIAEEDSSNEMEKAIKSMLGITNLDTLEKDLERILNKANKEVVTDQENQTLRNLRDERDKAKKALEDLDLKIESRQQEINEIEKELEILHVQYTTAGGDVVEQRQDLLNKKIQYSTQLTHTKEKLVFLASSHLPLAMVSDLLKDAYDYSKLENEEKANQNALAKVESIYQEYKKNNNEVNDFLQFMKDKVNQNKIDTLYNLSDAALSRLANYCTHELYDEVKETKEALKSQETTKQKINELENYLSVEIDEEQISRIYAQIKTTELKKKGLEAELNQLIDSRSSFNGQAISTNSEFNKFVEKILDKLESNDDADRLVKYTHQAINVIREYKKRLQARKASVLAQTMTMCYKKLASKQNMIERVEMDSDTLDFHYYNYSSQEVPKNSLSAGEKQLMIISLLWALAICSKKKLPVIIDTPLARLDSRHRTSLVTTYFPNASEQTIILSTDSEIDRHYYNLMKDSVGDEFLLVYDDENKNTTIRRGYFEEDYA